MASQDRDTSPQQPRTPRRTSVACCRCRGRKVKCAPLKHEPNRTCQRCHDGALTCEYMSVADEERRMSREPGFPGEHLTAAPGGLTLTQSPATVQQWSSGGMTSSSTVSPGASFVPWSPEYDAVSLVPTATAYDSYHVDYPRGVYSNPDTVPTSYAHDGGPWSQQLQSHAPTQQFNCITPGYTYDQGASMPVAYDYNQEIRTGIANRNQGFRDYNNDQDDQPEEKWPYGGT